MPDGIPDDFARLKKLVSKLIITEKIRNYTLHILENKVPAYFATAPASSSGQYHPAYSNGESGLVRHTMAVLIMAHYICSLHFFQIQPRMRDQILSACALHDVRKFGAEDKPAVSTRKDHPKLAHDLIYENSDIPEAAFIAKAILSHQGQFWTHKPAGIKEFIVHLADYLASRKGVTVDVYSTEV